MFNAGYVFSYGQVREGSRYVRDLVSFTDKFLTKELPHFLNRAPPKRWHGEEGSLGDSYAHRSECLITLVRRNSKPIGFWTRAKTRLRPGVSKQKDSD